MYALVSNGNVVGFCEKPNYVYYRPFMYAYYSTDNIEEADGIEFAGNLYNFEGQNKIEGKPEVTLVYRDGMEVVFNQQARIITNESNQVMIEDALFDMDTTNDERFTILEDAIIKLDSQLNG